MKLFLNYFLVVLLLAISKPSTMAQEPPIPANAWEQHPEGVAFALMLTKGIGNDSQSIYLVLYVKNTSNNPVPMRGGSALFFYLDSSGKTVILGNHHDPSHREYNIIENYQLWKVIPPGKMRQTSTGVTVAEVAVIKANTVKCKIILLDRAAQKEVPVVGSPQLLNPQSL